ncbi:hypothetical protein M8C21_032104, partial [Ambrosia artemisiifolia]
ERERERERSGKTEGGGGAVGFRSSLSLPTSSTSAEGSPAYTGGCVFDPAKENSPVVSIDGHGVIPKNFEQSLMKAVANQPVAVAIDAGGEDFQFYSEMARRCRFDDNQPPRVYVHLLCVRDFGDGVFIAFSFKIITIWSRLPGPTVVENAFGHVKSIDAELGPDLAVMQRNDTNCFAKKNGMHT